MKKTFSRSIKETASVTSGNDLSRNRIYGRWGRVLWKLAYRAKTQVNISKIDREFSDLTFRLISRRGECLSIVFRVSYLVILLVQRIEVIEWRKKLINWKCPENISGVKIQYKISLTLLNIIHYVNITNCLNLTSNRSRL